MATDKTLDLEHGDLPRITKLTKLQRLGPKGKGFSYDYVVACLDENDPRSNADITAIAQRLVAERNRSMALIAQMHSTKRSNRK